MKKIILCALLARLNSLSFYVLYTLFRKPKDEHFYVGFTKNLKLRFEQHEKGLFEAKTGKTYNGTIFLNKRLKSYLTG
jgi:predicted GIY-YIG superfamily endonuclease